VGVCVCVCVYVRACACVCQELVKLLVNKIFLYNIREFLNVYYYKYENIVDKNAHKCNEHTHTHTHVNLRIYYQ